MIPRRFKQQLAGRSQIPLKRWTEQASYYRPAGSTRRNFVHATAPATPDAPDPGQARQSSRHPPRRSRPAHPAALSRRLAQALAAQPHPADPLRRPGRTAARLWRRQLRLRRGAVAGPGRSRTSGAGTDPGGAAGRDHPPPLAVTPRDRRSRRCTSAVRRLVSAGGPPRPAPCRPAPAPAASRC